MTYRFFMLTKIEFKSYIVTNTDSSSLSNPVNQLLNLKFIDFVGS